VASQKAGSARNQNSFDRQWCRLRCPPSFLRASFRWRGYKMRRTTPSVLAYRKANRLETIVPDGAARVEIADG